MGRHTDTDTCVSSIISVVYVSVGERKRPIERAYRFQLLCITVPWWATRGNTEHRTFADCFRLRTAEDIQYNSRLDARGIRIDRYVCGHGRVFELSRLSTTVSAAGSQARSIFKVGVHVSSNVHTKHPLGTGAISKYGHNPARTRSPGAKKPPRVQICAKIEKAIHRLLLQL